MTERISCRFGSPVRVGTVYPDGACMPLNGPSYEELAAKEAELARKRDQLEGSHNPKVMQSLSYEKRIVQVLSGKPKTSQQIVEETGIAYPVVARAMNRMDRKGLVESAGTTRSKKNRLCQLWRLPRKK